jgi:hypothetical protein
VTPLDLIVGKGAVYQREVCDAFPVRQECLEAALADPELVGLWANTTERERREMQKQVA